MSATNNPYWKMTTKAMEESQRALNYFTQQMQDDHTGLKAVVTDASESYMRYIQEAIKNPLLSGKQSLNLTKNYAKIIKNGLAQAFGRDITPVIEPERGDQRFTAEAWTENAYFNAIKQLYLVTGEAWLQNIESLPGLDAKTKARAEFFVRQFINAMAPSNNLLTNPELLQLTYKSQGANLLQGFERFAKDLEKSADSLKISMTDDAAFKLGENIACTPGKVVYRCELFELIQYTPTTEKCLSTPLVVIPPFVNKYYVLDLSPKNSLVSWLVAQGHTVFMVSWVNPTEEHRNIGFDRYVIDGALHALEMVEKQTGVRELNVAAYCIGGTLLMTTLAYMAARRLKSRVKSATLLTTLTDFSDPGDIGVFVDDHIVKGIEHQNNHKGYFDGRVMAVSFSLLRENSLYWNYFVQNYLRGESPIAFDLLYWNSDSTNITAACHNEMLRKFYIENKLVKHGAYSINGTKIDLSKVNTPMYFLSAQQDHIARWKITYEGAKICREQATFVLAESGHIAGVVNPPAKNKYSYWTNNDVCENAEQWFEESEQHKGSWWSHWNSWLADYSGEEMDAREPETGALDPLCDAPGTYVKRRLGINN